LLNRQRALSGPAGSATLSTMEFTWTIPVALILAGATYAIFARYFAHRERLARIRSGADEGATPGSN
jgi:hypothetical protein